MSDTAEDPDQSSAFAGINDVPPRAAMDLTPARNSRRDNAPREGDVEADAAGIVLNRLNRLERQVAGISLQISEALTGIDARITDATSATTAQISEALTGIDARITDATAGIDARISDAMLRFDGIAAQYSSLEDSLQQLNAYHEDVSTWLETQARNQNAAFGRVDARLDSAERNAADFALVSRAAQLQLHEMTTEMQTQLRGAIAGLSLMWDAQQAGLASANESRDELNERFDQLVQAIDNWRRRISLRAKADKTPNNAAGVERSTNGTGTKRPVTAVKAPDRQQSRGAPRPQS